MLDVLERRCDPQRSKLCEKKVLGWRAGPWATVAGRPHNPNFVRRRQTMGAAYSGPRSPEQTLNKDREQPFEGPIALALL